ncbi:MAG: glutamate--tRNA ligase [Candidatus Omnitrophica bacterium]|nr:glutamate--tRNA ligase [Candidatus Omnitrophota bacterium]
MDKTTNSRSDIRVRFAPSPTGYLHIGNARTALFNYLFAKKTKGTLILRIEDTDKERSKKEYEENIIDDLKWIGIQWDEGPDTGGDYGPYRQTERIETYKEFAEKLLKEKKAYYCYCTKEEIEERNRQSQKEKSGYDNKCRNLTEKEAEKHINEGRKPVLRLLVPEKNVVVHDLIRGQVEFDTSLQNDFVIMKSDGTPTYHFAVVIDDLLMKITHVIRGEDHLSNTPKHILIYEALNQPYPQFAHMSMTLGPDRSRLSKRHGATSVRAYREDGYLSEAFFNYISLLGWTTGENREIFSKDELINEFSLERCSKVNAIFDPQKLLWLNGIYIRKEKPLKIFEDSVPFIRQSGILDEVLKEGNEKIEKIIILQQERIKTLKDVPDLMGFFIKEDVEYAKEEIEKFSNEEIKNRFKNLHNEFENIEFRHEILEENVRKFCEQNSLKTSGVFHPLRLAVTGRTKGPGLFETMEVIGKERVLKRIENFISIIEKNDPESKI